MEAKHFSSVFYAICDPESQKPMREMIVTERDEFEAALKSCSKQTRFKIFHKKSDAEDFLQNSTKVLQIYNGTDKDEQITQVKTEIPVNLENPECKSPSRTDLGAMRIVLEKGDVERFNEMVLANPRYIISAVDNPVIIMEGSRYNAMHIAARSNQAKICRAILCAVANPSLHRTLYPLDDDGTIEERISRLTDLYLNSPDKVALDTPLHMACKHGYKDVVATLTSYPQLDKSCVNKYDGTAEDVISRRFKGNKALVAEVVEMLSERYYVPLYRGDGASAGKVGLPQPLTSIQQASDTWHAYAGPTNLELATMLSNLWRNSHDHSITCTDLEKGRERIGRDICKSLGVEWREYWDFLQQYVDLASKPGCQLLEVYLKRRFMDVVETAAGSGSVSAPSPGLRGNVSVLMGQLSSSFIEALACAAPRLNPPSSPSSPSSSSSPRLAVPVDMSPSGLEPSSPSLSGLCGRLGALSTHGYTVGEVASRLSQHLSSPILCPHPSEQHLAHELQDRQEKVVAALAGLDLCDREELRAVVRASDLSLTLQLLIETYLDQTGDTQTHRHENNVGRAIEPVKFDLDDDPEDASVALNDKGTDDGGEDKADDGEDKDDGVGYEDVLKGESDDESSGFHTPPQFTAEELIEHRDELDHSIFFINGSRPTKLDLDVFHAIKDVALDGEEFPHISRWIHILSKFTEKARQSWLTPSRMRWKEVRGILPDQTTPDALTMGECQENLVTSTPKTS